MKPSLLTLLRLLPRWVVTLLLVQHIELARICVSGQYLAPSQVLTLVRTSKLTATLIPRRVQFSIDDFGTGYSSLAYLRRLPESVLKIDRSFVRNIEHDEGDRAICKTVLSLGQIRNMSIVAEGVETAQQFAYLEANGCDKFQGFLFSRPVPLSLLKDLVD